MKFTQALKMAFSALRSNLARSFLTMLGIIIGVLSVTMLITMVNGATDEMTGSLEGMGSNMITVNVNSPKQTYISMDDLKQLVGKDNIYDIAGASGSRGPTTIKAGTENMEMSVTGVTGNYSVMQEQTLDNGRFLTDLDVEVNSNNVVIDYETAKELFGTSFCTGSSLTIEGTEFTVVGVLEETDTTGRMNTSVVNIPISTAQRMFKNTELDNIYVQADTADDVDGVVETMEDYMMSELKDEDYFTVINNSALLDMMDQMTSTMTAILAGIASISLLVGGIGIMNIMLVSVTERTREIGVRKAIGARRGDILIQFVIEALVLCLAGGIIGLLLGYGGLAIASGLMGMAFSMSLSTISLAVCFSLAVGLIFGIYPANKASKLRPIEALRYE